MVNLPQNPNSSMKKTLALVSVAFALLFSCVNTGKEKITDNIDTVAQDSYQCPMKCEGDKKYAEKGACPVCKMEMKSTSQALQENKPKSPRTSTMAMVGANHVHIDYGSPSVRNRVIWNGLVAYGNVWATGAHKATWVEFSAPVMIGEKVIEKGRYGFFTIPNENEWTLILNSAWDMHLADDYDPNLDVIRLNVVPKKSTELVEALTYEVTAVDDTKGEIRVSWEYLSVSFGFENIKPKN